MALLRYVPGAPVNKMPTRGARHPVSVSKGPVAFGGV